MPNRSINTHAQSGFTLVEVLIATAIFVITLVLALDIFMVVVRDQFTEIRRKQVEDEVLYIFGTMTVNIDHENIDYSAYTSLPLTDALYMNDNGKATLIALGSNPLISGDSDKIYETDYSTIAPLTGEHTSIDSLQFYVYPSSDPNDTSSATYTNNQSTVVMFIKAHHVDHPEIVVEYQTMITSRYYGR